MARSYRKLTKEEVEPIVADCYSVAEVLRRLGKSPVGGSITNMSLMLKRWGVDTSHFTGLAHRTGKVAKNRKSADDHLVMRSPMDHRQKGSVLSRCLKEKGIEYKCNCCGISEWLGKPLVLEVDHIDECHWNNTLENLQFLCPNCHAMKGK